MKSNLYRKAIIFSIALISFGLLVSFQNCTKAVSFSDVTLSPTNILFSPIKSENNGEIYLGKPGPGAYVKSFPSYKCENQSESIQSWLTVGNSDLIVENDNCTDMNLQILFNDAKFSHSFFNPDFVFVKNVPYEKESVFEIENRLSVDAFCKSEEADFGIHVISKRNSEGRLKVKIYTGQKNSDSTFSNRKVSLFDVSQTDSDITSLEASNFSLKINSTTDSSGFYFQGSLSAVIDNQKMSSQLLCYRMSRKSTLTPELTLAARWQFNGSLIEMINNLTTFVSVGPTGYSNYVLGRYNQGLGIGGGNTFINIIGGSNGIHDLENLTVSFWILPRAVGGNLISASAPGRGSAGTFKGWRIYQLASGEVVFEQALDTITYVYSTSGNFLNLGVWNHVAVTLATNDFHYATIFVNGVYRPVVETLTSGTPATIDDRNNIKMGGMFDGGGPLETQAAFDQVSIWRSSYSNRQLFNLYQNGVLIP